MNEKITAELDLPGVGLGAGVTGGCLLACYSEPMVRCVWLFIAAAVLAFSLFTGKLSKVCKSKRGCIKEREI